MLYLNAEYKREGETGISCAHYKHKKKTGRSTSTSVNLPKVSIVYMRCTTGRINLSVGGGKDIMAQYHTIPIHIPAGLILHVVLLGPS